MDKAILGRAEKHGAGLGGLEEDLRRQWTRRTRGSTQYSSGHRQASEAQVPLSDRRVPSDARFLGRQVLNGSLAHAEGKIRAQVTDLGIEGYRSVLPPIGLRILGYRALQDLKAYSRAVDRGDEVESVLNPDVRVISHFDEIMETALADMDEESARYASENATVYTDGMNVLTYHNEDDSSVVVVGAKIVNRVDQWEAPVALRAERNYFLRHYAPGYDTERKPHSTVFIPLGLMPGMEWQDNYIAALREGQMENLQHLAVRLGPVGLASEVGWAEA